MNWKYHSKIVSVDEIYANPITGRSHNQKSILALAAHIKDFGLIRPITVRDNSFGYIPEGYKYALIDGFHRFSAIKHLGQKTIWVMIASNNDNPDEVRPDFVV